MMKLNTFKHLEIVLVSVAISLGLSTQLHAFEFRGFQPFGPPDYQGQPGAIPPEELGLELKPIPRAAIVQAVTEFFNAWKNGNADALISPRFQNKQRLLDAIIETVPRDAQINLLGISSTSTLPNDVIEMSEDGQSFVRLSLVTATVRTQIIFNDSNGRQVIDGENDYVFEVREEYR